jgi:hypothetical protein
MKSLQQITYLPRDSGFYVRHHSAFYLGQPIERENQKSVYALEQNRIQENAAFASI